MRHDLPLFRRCPRCGADSAAGDDGRCYRCAACGFVYFHNTASATAALVLWRGHLLVTRRAHAPGAGLLDLPGGFVEPGETLEAALARELCEELGWPALPAPPRYLCSQPNRYLYAGVEYATCDAFFVLAIDGARPVVTASRELTGHDWPDLATLAPDDFAFASVRMALGHLRETLAKG
ncbi:MAG: NUDIX domain-containing protein [Gammaproteobacteria bacterium]|nr:NUDIX domain-containing protein [Gammaproteobacteria bacterium]